MKGGRIETNMNIPVIGLGTWKITDREQLVRVIRDAYESGYRLFDTAAAYGNEIALGRAFRENGIPRREIWLQDKLWNTCYGYEKAQEACKRSLKKLKTDYLDVYLVHWPASPKVYADWQEINAETWRGMERLYQDGYARAIGVCNFKKHHLEMLCRTAVIFPFINQVECHPGLRDLAAEEYCREKGIALQASSPLGNGTLLTNPELKELAEKKGITAAQLCLCWGLQHGYAVIPKTVNRERMEENIASAKGALSEEEMQVIDRMPYCGGLGIDADEVVSFE